MFEIEARRTTRADHHDDVWPPLDHRSDAIEHLAQLRMLDAGFVARGEHSPAREVPQHQETQSFRATVS